jgi:hypothetical protein
MPGEVKTVKLLEQVLALRSTSINDLPIVFRHERTCQEFVLCAVDEMVDHHISGRRVVRFLLRDKRVSE